MARNPTKIIQSFELFGATGRIDKEKRVYYVPHSDEMNNKASQLGGSPRNNFVFYNLFKEKLTQGYTATPIDISGWNPEDRTLKVEFFVDMFREGGCNYLILKRQEVNDDGTIPEGSYPEYMAYFITDATQVGIKSTRLTLEEDYFTNFFFLEDTGDEAQEGSYDIKDRFHILNNTYVERQHYNRVSSTMGYNYYNLPNGRTTFSTGKLYTLRKDISTLSGTESIIVGLSTNIRVFKIVNNVKTNVGGAVRIQYSFLHRRYELDMVGSILYLPIDEYSISSEVYGFELLLNNLNGYVYDNVNEAKNETFYKPENLELFAKTKDTYEYRQQIKYSREPLAIYKYDEYRDFSDNGNTYIQKLPDLSQVVTESDIYNWFNSSSVSRNDKQTVINACVQYLHILTKDRITIPTVIKDTNTNKYLLANYSSDFESGKNIPSAQQHLVIPFIAETRGVLRRFTNYFKKWGIKFNANHGEDGVVVDLGVYSDGDMANFITRLEDVFGYYIQSIYITPYSEASYCLGYESFFYSEDDEAYRITVDAPIFLNEGISQTSPIYKSNIASWLGLTQKGSVSKKLDDYDSRVVYRPTMVFIGQNKPETIFPQSVTTPTDTFEALKGAIDYYSKSIYRKNVAESEEYKDTPVTLFDAQLYTDTDYVGLDSMVKSSDFNNTVLFPALYVGTKGFDEVRYPVKSTVRPQSFKTGYYEPVLEFEPYTSNTFSFLEVESAIQKRRLVYSYEVVQETNGYTISYFLNLKYNQVVNAQFKMGLIPTYIYDEVIERHYNDALIYISSQGMTVRNNSFYEYTYNQSASMIAQRYLQALNPAIDMAKYVVNDIPYNIGSGMATGGWKGAIEGAGRSLRDVQNMTIDYFKDINTQKVEHEAQLAGAGAKADAYSSVGTELYYDLNNEEYKIYHNIYSIDDLSYKNISKMLERYGYRVDLYDKLNIEDRIGWNYIKLISFDYLPMTWNLSKEIKDTIEEAFRNGVTLVHDYTIYRNDSGTLHNYEYLLEEE